MVLTPHILAGAVIGAEVKNIWVVLGLGLASHYLMDALPHWDYSVELNLKKIKDMAKIGLDLLIGLTIVFVVAEPLDWYLAAGIFFALLPDLIQFLYLGFGLDFLKPLTRFHRWIHFDKRLGLFSGLGLILLFCLAFVSVLIY